MPEKHQAQKGIKRHIRYAVPTAMLIVAGCASACTSAGTGTGTGAAVATGASPSSGVATSTAASPEPYCTAADNLKTSVGDLRKINIVGGGLAAVQQAVTNIQTNLTAFETASKSQFGTQVTELRSSLSGVQNALQAAKANTNISTLGGVVASVTGVVSSYTALQNAISSRCG
jgi:uncharacterized lipoprotein NlpE involved in copper resistance